MSEEELGIDPTIVEGHKRYTSIERGDRTERLYLEGTIKQQRSVAGRATICWSGFAEDMPNERLVIKDSWEYEERPEEGHLLREATEAGVKNVARYYHHETVRIGGQRDDICNNVRKGLSGIAGRNPLQRRAVPTGSITNSTSDISGSRRGRSGSSSRTMTRKRSSSSIQASMPPPKRSCSNSPVKQDMLRKNRVHRRLVVRDVGKPLYEASSLCGILRGLLGGIKGEQYVRESKRWLTYKDTNHYWVRTSSIETYPLGTSC